MVITTLQDHKFSEVFPLEAILARIPKARVTVFGDFCLDAYWSIDEYETEKSIETGLPLKRVREQLYSLGGAGNVVANLIDLGVRDVKAVGVVGADLFGRELLRLLNDRGADTRGIVVLQEPWQTFVYAKPCSDSGEDSRLDFGSLNELQDEAIESLTAALNLAAASSNVVVLNQQIPSGVSTCKMISRINEVITKQAHTRFIVDARNRAGLYRGAIFKLNAREAANLLDVISDDEVIRSATAKEYAERLFAKTRHPVFITRGQHGLLVADDEVVQEIPGIQLIGATDSVGAGDTVVAALAAVLGSGGSSVEAATVANIAASITVQKLRTTGTATPDEIRANGEPDYVYNDELAQDSHLAQFVEGSEIELVSDLPQDICIKHAIFDHDGTISTLRQGWEQIMEPMMVKAVLGHHFDNANPQVYARVRETVREFIDKTTGVQTLVQMQGLMQLVRQFRFVPEDEILDEHGYKKIYNNELMKLVQKRTRKMQSGELHNDDFQIKGVRRLLENLHSGGVKLYLVSGTDEVDVQCEAEVMGYAGFFEGRIFGAVGDVKVEAKRIVLERLIRDHKLSGHEFVTFGDGPVEMRETFRRGGIRVGVASDEIRRFGWNMSKRARLIRAGAQLIIPDFTQPSVLMLLLRLA